MVPSSYSKKLAKVFCLVLFLSIVPGVSAQSLQDFFIPEDVLPPDWVTLFKSEQNIDSIAAIYFLDVEYLKAWGFKKAVRQAFQTPKGWAYIIIEEYGDSTGPPKRLEYVKHRNEIQGDPNRIEKSFSGCGQEGLQTKYIADADNSIHKIFFFQGSFFFIVDSFDEQISAKIGQWICGILSETAPPPTESSPRLVISAPSKISILPHKQNEFEYRVLNRGSGLEQLIIEVRSSNPDKLSVIYGGKFPNVRLEQGKDWGGTASLGYSEEEEARFKVYIFVNDSRGETIKYQAIDIEVLPVKIDIKAPNELQMPTNSASFDFNLINMGRELDSIRIHAEFKTSPPSGHAYVSPASAQRSVGTNKEIHGNISIQMNNMSTSSLPLYIQVLDRTGKIITEKPVQILFESKRSSRNIQTFLQTEVSPESLWLLPGETKPLNIKLENVGEGMAPTIRITAKSADKDWIDVVGEQVVRVDPSSGAKTTTYRALSNEYSFNLNVGETREKIIFIKAGTVGSDYIYISVKGDNFPSLEESILIQVSPKGTPRTKDEEMSRLFDPNRSGQILFQKMDKDEMYRWEGGNLYYGDCTYIPGYGPSCDLNITPKSVVYVTPDLSDKSSRLNDLYRIYGSILSASSQSRTNIVKTTFGIVGNYIPGSETVDLYSKIRQAETESGSSGLADMAGFLLGPLADAYNLIENLREKNLSFMALKGFFPGADFGYIHHSRNKEGQWDSVYSKAFFVRDMKTDIYYVYVIHERLQ